MSADHRLRPIIHPNQPLPYYAGYAECVNAGKSKWNEDQAVIQRGVLINESNKNRDSKFAIPYTYYGIFDGHAGVGAALCAANQLHHILHVNYTWVWFHNRNFSHFTKSLILNFKAFKWFVLFDARYFFKH